MTILTILTCFLLILRAFVATSNGLFSFPKHEFGKPSYELIGLYHSGFMDVLPHRLKKYFHGSPLVKMNIKSKRSSLNVDNLVGLESIVCRKDELHIVLNKEISIANWNISNGVVFLVNPHWNCMGKHEAVFLHSEACLVKSTKELIFAVSKVHPSDVIQEYEFMVRPNNEYHRNILFYDRVIGNESSKSKDHLNPFNFSYNGNIFDSRSILSQVTSNYFQLSCDACSITGTTELSAHIRGPSLLNKAHAILETGIGSALNLNLNFVLTSFGSLFKGISWKQNLFKLKLFSWSIPGIFEPDFSFRIDISSNLKPLAQGQSRFKLSLNHDFSKVNMHSKDGILTTTLDDTHPVLSANSSSDSPGINFMGSIDFSPSIVASFSFFKRSVPIASVSYNTGFSAVVDSFTRLSKKRCRLNSFDLVAFGKFKGSIGNHTKSLLNPLIKSLKHGCLDEMLTAAKEYKQSARGDLREDITPSSS